mmetsp:Transcript_26131/g.66524  ORF Transcript_26131/g.66524 Transcript_26131/m.66524 type:complete len:231 (-) Transcript_26131:639-1331(-)
MLHQGSGFMQQCLASFHTSVTGPCMFTRPPVASLILPRTNRSPNTVHPESMNRKGVWGHSVRLAKDWRRRRCSRQGRFASSRSSRWLRRGRRRLHRPGWWWWCRRRHDVARAAVGQELARQLRQQLGSQRVTAVLEVAELDKLHDVALRGLAMRGQPHLVAVQDLHVGELGVADAHDEDGHGQLRGLDDGAHRVVHVHDLAVRQDEQHVVAQVRRGLRRVRHGSLDDGRE